MKIEVDAISSTVTLGINGTYTAQELLDVLTSIGKARAQIAKDPTSPVGQPLEAIGNPAYWTEPNHYGSLIAIHHPGYGWLGFVFALAEAAKLSTYITNQLLLAANQSTASTAAEPGTSGDANGGRLLH